MLVQGTGRNMASGAWRVGRDVIAFPAAKLSILARRGETGRDEYNKQHRPLQGRPNRGLKSAVYIYMHFEDIEVCN